MEAMTTKTIVTVVAGGFRSAAFRPRVGMPEGRVLSPPMYCVGTAAKLEMIEARVGPGAGLDPHPDALRAFLAATDGTDAPVLDEGEVAQWQVLREGGANWDTVMAGASSDAVRATLLDSTATVRVGLRAFVDDMRAKASSRGHCGTVAEALEAASRRHRGRLRSALGDLR